MVFDRATDVTTPSDFLPGQDILLHLRDRGSHGGSRQPRLLARFGKRRLPGKARLGPARRGRRQYRNSYRREDCSTTGRA
jgi:hypothetical protein